MLSSLRISPLFFNSVITITILYTAAFIFNVVYIQSIGSGIGTSSEVLLTISSAHPMTTIVDMWSSEGNFFEQTYFILSLSSSLISTKFPAGPFGLQRSPAGDKQNIPWNDTAMMKGNRIVLNKMYEHYSSNPTVKSFLDAKVKHLLTAPIGDTGISYSSLTKNSILTNPATKTLTERYKSSLFTSDSGVYVVQSHNTKDLYVGSATNFTSRFNNHYSSLRKSTRLNVDSSTASKFYVALRDIGPTQFSWSPIVITPNYHKEFILLNKESFDLIKDNHLFNVLLHFTQYEARSIEQAIISAIEPSLNTDYEVSFILEWNSDKEYIDHRGSKPIQAIEKNSGIIHYFNSIRQAADLLDVKKQNIQTYINFINFHKSNVLGEYVRFVDITKPMNVGHPYSKEDLPLLTEINYNEIPLGKIWAYDVNFNKIGEFTSSLKAASYFNISKGAVLNNLNKKFTNGTFEGVLTSILFCRNILGAISKKISVVVIDQHSNQAYLYPSIISASQAIGMGESINSGTVRNKWIKTGKLYKDRWLIVEESNYTGKNIVTGPLKLV